jgi:hypothetical protein
LYLTTESNPTGNAAQVAQSGIGKGIAISKSAGDVSIGYETLKDLEGWAAWALTNYGQQLATFAKVVGAGPVYIY